MTGGGVKNIYVGTPNQRGKGIGSFLGGLARNIYPILKKGISSIAQESVHAGTNILGDVLSGRSVKYSAKRRLIDSTDKLKRKFNDYLMEGEGSKKKRKKRCKSKNKIGRGKKKKSQSSKRRKRKKTSLRLKKKIFKKQKQKKRCLKRRKKANKVNFDIFS